MRAGASYMCSAHSPGALQRQLSALLHVALPPHRHTGVQTHTRGHSHHVNTTSACVLSHLIKPRQH